MEIVQFQLLPRLTNFEDPAQLLNGNLDAVRAVVLLFCMVVVPALLRIRILYTFSWVGFALLAHHLDSEAALGMATYLGLTIMSGWYSLRLWVDPTTFSGILQGWFGFVSKYRIFCVLANVGDFLLHGMVPMALAYLYLHLVRMWMIPPILIFSKLWLHLIVNGNLYPRANQVYMFDPPRSKAFWEAASKIELFCNLTIPVGCVATQSIATFAHSCSY